MLKRMISKKILVTTLVLFALALFYVVPNNSKASLENIDQELEYVDVEFKTHDIFLLDSNNYLSLTKVIIENSEIVPLAKELLNVLIKDGVGESIIPSGFKSIIPSDTEIISISYDNNVLKVNLSKEFLETKDEEKIIESIIFTLTSIKDVDKLILYKNGEILSKLPGIGKILPSTFDRSYGINKRYNIINLDDILNVTVYYINEHNGDYYYVPVTNYLNSTRDKISIIVDELNNNFAYINDLMSFLNEDVKLVNFSVNENVMNLEFNEAIFNSVDEKDILEEVIYTIALSIKDNYDVNEVVFKVKNEEIIKKSLE